MRWYNKMYLGRKIHSRKENVLSVCDSAYKTADRHLLSDTGCL